MTAENQQNFFRRLSWLFRAEDSTGSISERNVWFESEKNRCLYESTKHLGWMKAVFWVMAAQGGAFLISLL